MGMHWICCPYCKEVTDLKRLGKPSKKGIVTSKRVKCGFCGKTFTTDGATIWEVFGRDGVGDVPF